MALENLERNALESWGRYPKAKHRGLAEPRSAEEARQVLTSQTAPVLPRGVGRSYGDSCLNDDGYLLLTVGLKRVHMFDDESGVIRCESGLTLDELIRIVLPFGWFVPVTPGTKFVTVGGAIANDIHGKNHHSAGSFGNHVRMLELVRSDGQSLCCSRTQNEAWFRATLGGLGLTGLILWAEIELKRVTSPYLDAESIRFGNLTEFASLSRESRAEFEYSVAWVDALATGRRLGRGVFFRGNHSKAPVKDLSKTLHSRSQWIRVPGDMPAFVLSPALVRIFNTLYYHRQVAKRRGERVHYDPFFYPLDSLQDWNRLYGRRGFLQWQCVVPFDAGYECVRVLLTEIAQSKMGSFLTVLKEFGPIPSEGLLSFPTPGITLALDFANTGTGLLRMLNRLDAIVAEAKGKLYPAKDARMSGDMFRASFPRFVEFSQFVDPKISSSFWRRVSKPEG